MYANYFTINNFDFFAWMRVAASAKHESFFDSSCVEVLPALLYGL